MRHIHPPVVFETPRFRRLIAVASLGTLAQGSLFTVLGWVIAVKTGSPVLVALLFVTIEGPQIVAGPLGGAAADRIGRSRILRSGLGARGGVTLLIALGVAWDPSAVWLILILNTAGATVFSATVPARRALIADVVPRSDLTSAISMEQFGTRAGYLVAPFITGFLLTIIDAEIVLAGIAVLLVVASILVPTVLRPVTSTRDRETRAEHRIRYGVISALMDGLRFAWTNPVVRSLLAVGFIGEFLAFNYFALIPIFTTDVFAGGAALQGSLQGMISVGEVVGVLAIAWIGSRIVNAGRWFFFAVAGAHIIAIPLAFATSLPPVFPLLMLLGVAGSLWGVLQSRIILEAVPEDSRARVLGVQQFTWGAGAIGGLTAGALAEYSSPASAVGGMAIVGLAMTALIIAFSPELRRNRIS